MHARSLFRLPVPSKLALLVLGMVLAFTQSSTAYAKNYASIAINPIPTVPLNSTTSTVSGIISGNGSVPPGESGNSTVTCKYFQFDPNTQQYFDLMTSVTGPITPGVGSSIWSCSIPTSVTQTATGFLVEILFYGDANYYATNGNAAPFTVSGPTLQALSVTAANITVYAGQPETQTVAQLLASYNAPNLTGTQLATEFANAEVGFTVSGPGFSSNIPLYSYGTYYGNNLLQQVPAGAPTGTFTLTPYLIGPGAANFNFTETPGTLTIAAATSLQPLSITAANITVYAGVTPTQTVAQLMASYNAPGLTGLQLESLFANCEVGFSVSVDGGSYNIPLFANGTYLGANLLNEVPAGAPTGTFTLTPYITGPGANQFSFTETPGTLTIANQ